MKIVRGGHVVTNNLYCMLGIWIGAESCEQIPGNGPLRYELTTYSMDWRGRLEGWQAGAWAQPDNLPQAVYQILIAGVKSAHLGYHPNLAKRFPELRALEPAPGVTVERLAPFTLLHKLCGDDSVFQHVMQLRACANKPKSAREVLSATPNSITSELIARILGRDRHSPCLRLAR